MLKLVPIALASLIATTASAQQPAQDVGQWRNMGADVDAATFFDQASLKASGTNAAQAKTAMAWRTPDQAIYPGFTISNVSVVVESWQGDCQANTITLADRVYYSETGELLKDVRAANLKAMTPQAGTQGFAILNLLCGRQQLLGGQFDGGPALLVKVVRETRVAPKPADKR